MAAKKMAAGNYVATIHVNSKGKLSVTTLSRWAERKNNIRELVDASKTSTEALRAKLV